MQKIVPPLGRILLSFIFLMAGLNQIGDFAGTQQYMASKGMPATGFFLVGAIILELFGSISLILGYKARWGAVALIIFLIPTTLVFHTKFSVQGEMIMFMKNLSILGGLFLVASLGPGAFSIDARKKSSQA